MKLTVASSLVLLVASTYAVGINCRGSGLCHSDGAAGSLMSLKEIVDHIQPRHRHYNTGQQIACTGSLCASYQHGASGTAEGTSALLQALLDYGCKNCGSIPTSPGNNVRTGDLNVNVVGHPPCQGAC